jgi:hypothetical protein
VSSSKTWLYSISRRDIPLAQQAVQAAHAAIEHAYQYGRPADHHPSYIHLVIRDQQKLMQLRDVLHATGIQTAEFHEPYQDWGLTAISCCLTENERHLLKGLQLWKLPTQEVTA